MDGGSASASGAFEAGEEVITVFLKDILGPDEHINSIIGDMFGVGPSGEDIELTDDEDEPATAQISLETRQQLDPILAEMFGIGPSGEDLELTDEEVEEMPAHGELLANCATGCLAQNTGLTIGRLLKYRPTVLVYG